MNSLVTALPGLVPIFISAGGVNALAGVLFRLKVWVVLFYSLKFANGDFPSGKEKTESI